MERIQKIIAASGLASRRAAEQMVADGRVRVNGQTVTQPGFPVSPEDRIEVDGKALPAAEQKAYYLLNKPAGFVTTNADDKGRPTVLDLVPVPERVFPVGRLDYDTTGVLILTNDGDFMNALLHPRFHVEKEYQAKIGGILRREESARLTKGIDLGDFTAAPARIAILDADAATETTLLRIVIAEGRYHQVKRMFEAVGHPVLKLARMRFGDVTCEGLPVGAFRRLKPHEVKRLWNLSRFGPQE